MMKMNIMQIHFLLRHKGRKISNDPKLLEDFHFAVPEKHLEKDPQPKRTSVSLVVLFCQGILSIH